MKKFAKIINEDTKTVVVGMGTNESFYHSEGMTKMDVEQGFDGVWYIAGFAPEKPEKIRKQEEIDALKFYLRETDWIVAKIAEKSLKKERVEDDLNKYADTLEQRAAARSRINELEVM